MISVGNATIPQPLLSYNDHGIVIHRHKAHNGIEGVVSHNGLTVYTGTPLLDIYRQVYLSVHNWPEG